MESMIIFMEDLRAFILDDREQAQLYGRFLDSHGYGSTGCSHLDGSDRTLSNEDVMLFERVANVLRQFLASAARSQGIGDQGQSGGDEAGQDAEHKDEGAE